ncbi:MAG: hypothetical protein M1818_007951 [Claussenomyces sp. TS43310]|nr:MAG: hypothetical protein M1818_007951 [Claussenomyces sp. TS43310]
MSPQSTGTTSLHRAMSDQLSRRREKSLLRRLSIAPAETTDFSSNDFLSLSTSPRLREAFLHELQQTDAFRLGSGGSRLLDGNSAYAEALERDIAAFHNAPAGLLFNSGFDANAGFFACVPQAGDIVLYDEFIHASVHEGMRLSRARRTLPFEHNCVASLRERLQEVQGADERVRRGEKSVFVAVESLYSMDGDLAPLAEIVQVVEEALPHGNGHIAVDEAHSTGVYGPRGRGLVCSLGLEKRVFARLSTFGKALGCNGSILLCDELTRSYLINYARPLIYTTFMSFPALAAIRASYSLLFRGDTEPLAQNLQCLIDHLHDQLQALARSHGLSSQPQNYLRISSRIPKSPIFSILTPEPRDLARWCQERGFMVRAIVAPTVPTGKERVRICLHAGNTLDEIDRLVGTIARWATTKVEKREVSLL